MSSFQLTLGRQAGNAPVRIEESLRDGSVCRTVVCPGFRAEVATGPELGLFHVTSASDHAPQMVLLVFGFVVFDGRVCSGAEDATQLLEAWRRSGRNMLDALDGAFLIVIHDVDRDQTSLISDPFGSRPLWMAETADSLHCSDSPLDAAQRTGLVREPDPAWVWSMLKFRRTVGERSSIRGVHGLPSGSVLTYERGRSRIETWFDFTFTPMTEKKPATFGAELLDLTRTSVERTCSHSDSPALLLSGGLDSRLLAAVCPPKVQTLTLCDSVNREVMLACRIAQAAGLDHEVVVRSEEWYPDLLEPSCRLGGGVWLWDQAHFLPLGEHGRVPDATLLGYGSDTLFKGKDIDRPELWRPRLARCSTDELVAEALEMLDRYPAKIKGGEGILRPDFALACREAFMEESRMQLESLVETCAGMPDIWQSFWGRNLARATAFMNLVSLRGFTRERNVFTTVAMRRFYQTLPATLRRSGQLPLLALRAGGFDRLRSIPDANTWLPYTVPRPFHSASAAARRMIAGVRKKMRSHSLSTDYRSKGSWPHNGRLWLHSRKMNGLMEQFVEGEVFDGYRFNRSAVAQSWAAHTDGRDDFSGLLDFLGTYGCVFRSNAMDGEEER